MGDPESSVWRAVTAQHWLPVLRAEARTPGFHAPSHDSPGAGPSLENAASVVQESLFPWDTKTVKRESSANYESGSAFSVDRQKVKDVFGWI